MKECIDKWNQVLGVITSIQKTNSKVSIDTGIKNLAMLSGGKMYESIKPLVSETDILLLNASYKINGRLHPIMLKQ